MVNYMLVYIVMVDFLIIAALLGFNPPHYGPQEAQYLLKSDPLQCFQRHYQGGLSMGLNGSVRHVWFIFCFTLQH